MQSRFVMRCVVWAAVYTFFILGPMFALLLGSHPPARDFWTEFSAAIGYAGLAMMGLQSASPVPNAPLVVIARYG